jgi:type II secretory pathway component PulF
MSRSVRDQAECYRQLATLIAAGLPPARAVLQLSPFPQQARLAADLRRGRSLASAVADAGLARPWEQPLLTAAETAGRLPETLARLADHHEAVSRRLRKLRGQMLLPAAAWALALFVLPLPALVRGDLDATAYLLRSLLPLLLLLVGARLWVHAWRRARAQQALLPGERHLHRLPWLGTLLIEAQRAQGLQVLALLLQAGLPADVALRSSAEAVQLPSLRRGLAAAARAAADGVAWIDSLPAAGLVHRGAERALLQSGEAAGRVDDTVTRLARSLQAEVDDRFDSLGRWLPRVLYVLLVIPILT